MYKKRLYIFTENLYGGGVQRILQIICQHFDYEHYDVTLYSVVEDAFVHEDFSLAIKYKYLLKKIKQEQSLGEKFWAKIQNKIKLFVYYHFSPSLFYKFFIREQADVVVAFIEGYATRIVAGFPERVKRIAWLHTDMKGNHWSSVAFRSEQEERDSYKIMDHVVCVSKIVKIKADEIFNLSNTVILYNPIDTERIVSLSKHPDGLMAFPSQKNIRIVSIGALMEVKGYDRLLRVVYRLKQEGLNFELFILGEGFCRRSLETYIEEHDLSLNVKLLGFVKNPYSILKTADIYVCSSYAEGFNTAITEALVLGRAVVATDISGVREQLGEKGEYGIIVDNSDDGIYQGLKNMMNPGEVEYYQKMAAIRGRDFNLTTQMKKIYNLLNA